MILVTLQMASILYLVATTNFTVKPIPIIIIVAGIALGLISIAVMSKSKLRVTPEPAQQATLIQTGPYKFIRHPMYTSVLLFCAGCLVMSFSIYGTCVWLFLLIVLLIKLNYEEEMLLEAFPEYKEYMQRSYRLLPYLY